MNYESENEIIRLVLVDDHLLFRQSLKSMLSECDGFQVVGESGDGRKGLQMIQTLRPRVAILDITMPSISGIELAGMVHDTDPDICILILSMHDNVSYAFEAFKAGCRGYVLKSDSRDDLFCSYTESRQGGKLS